MIGYASLEVIVRKYTVEHTVYTFDELSDEAKQVAIEKMRESENEFGFHFLSDDMLDHLTEVLLPEYKIKFDETPKIYYSLSYCQGDGAMFEGTFTWQGRYTAYIKQSGHYYHYNSKDIELLTRAGNEASVEKQKEFDDVYVEICRKLEKYGYDEIEYQLSDEAIIETINANEYEFYETGVMA